MFLLCFFVERVVFLVPAGSLGIWWMEAIGLLYAQFYSSCTPFRVRKVLELCPGLVEFIVVSIFFFFNSCNWLWPEGACTTIVTVLLNLWVMVTISGSSCEAKMEENVPALHVTKVCSLPFIFFLYLLTRGRKKKVVSLWTLCKVLCVPQQES